RAAYKLGCFLVFTCPTRGFIDWVNAQRLFHADAASRPRATQLCPERIQLLSHLAHALRSLAVAPGVPRELQLELVALFGQLVDLMHQALLTGAGLQGARDDDLLQRVQFGPVCQMCHKEPPLSPGTRAVDGVPAPVLFPTALLEQMPHMLPA